LGPTAIERLGASDQSSESGTNCLRAIIVSRS
jgi:hypothetical protein